MELIILLIISYLTGSLPSSIIISRVAKNNDIRDHGSGNAGATNVYRVLGRKYALIVLFALEFLRLFKVASWSYLRFVVNSFI